MSTLICGPVSSKGSISAAEIPWEERPAGCSDVVWRSTRNPIIPRNAIPCANSIFNSAVVRFGSAFAGVFRVDDKRRFCRLHAGFSSDGVNWRINPQPIEFVPDSPGVSPFEYGYDPRVCFIEGRYYVTWCNGLKGQPTIGLAWTTDFKTFHQMENAFLPYNRNGVLFPRRINGKFAMLSRPSDPAHTPFGDIYYSDSPDLCYWGKHRHVMGPLPGWQRTKIGAGPVPIETEQGWLVFYHGVLNTCSGMTYSCGAALLDLEKPWQVIMRSSSYLLAPHEPYECVGDVPNVVFPCAALVDETTGRIAIYYGAADTVVGLAFTRTDEVIASLRAQ